LPSGRQLNDLRKQIIDVTDKLDVTERKTTLGVPRRKREPDWAQLARYGAAAIAAVAGSQLLSRGKEFATDTASKLAGKGREAADTATDKAREVAEKGREAADTATDEVEEVVDEGEEAAQDATETGEETAEQATEEGEQATEEGEQATEEGEQAAEEGSDDGEVRQDGGRDRQTKRQRLIIQHQIDIAVPRSLVYDRWARFVDLAGASNAVQDVTQEDETATSGQDQILFATRSWDAEVVEHIPNRRIGWESSGDVHHRGVATFHELADDLTRAQVEMEYHPQGDVDDVGDLFHAVRQRVEKDLRLFKHHLEFEVGSSAGQQDGGSSGTGSEPDDGPSDQDD
jgi:uncharacterized membrane protein